MPAPRHRSAAQGWVVRIIVALAPIWVLSTLYRGLWTPDEPREADIAWRMSEQNDRTLPQLAGTPFLEKPPLSYWMSADALRLFGDSPAAARAPNILYAAVTALAVGALAFVMAGNAAAIIAALVSATAIILFRVNAWLAPDACLLAGCAVGLLGAWLGFNAPAGRRKLLGYSVMHVGAAIGFMAKSAPGWMAPALAIGAIIAWERRWSELRRWELYAGFILQALIIGPWIWAVTQAPGGSDALLALFWHNVVGRFTKVSGPAALALATSRLAYLAATLVALAVTFVATRLSAQAQARGDFPRSFGWTYTTYATALCLMALATFPAIDRWHDLSQLAERIHADSAQDDLALLSPDETTIAMLDNGLKTRFTILPTESGTGGSATDTPQKLVSAWFQAHGTNARVLVLLPGHAAGELTGLLDRLHPVSRPDDGTAGALAAEGIASLLQRYEVPEGRRYALLGPPAR